MVQQKIISSFSNTRKNTIPTFKLLHHVIILRKLRLQLQKSYFNIFLHIFMIKYELQENSELDY